MVGFQENYNFLVSSLDLGGMLMFIFVTVFTPCLMWWRTKKGSEQLSSFVPVLLSVVSLFDEACVAIPPSFAVLVGKHDSYLDASLAII